MNPLGQSQKGLKTHATNIMSQIPDERLYFAGLKDSASMPNDKHSSQAMSLTDYISDTFFNNPLTSMGVGLVAGLGLYYGLGRKKPVPKPSEAQNYINAMKSVVVNASGLIACHGIVKYMTQESPEVTKLKNDIRTLKHQKAKPQIFKPKVAKNVALSEPLKYSFSIEKEVKNLFS